MKSNEQNELSQIYIGVELECLNTEMCTWQQLDSLAELIVAVLGREYNWQFPYDIIGHYEVAEPIGRRSDPKGFNWGYFMGYLYSQCKGMGLL